LAEAIRLKMPVFQTWVGSEYEHFKRWIQTGEPSPTPAEKWLSFDFSEEVVL
jgi:hypothetical protein